MKNFLDISEVPKNDLKSILGKAHSIKEARQGMTRGMADDDDALKGCMVALIFEKPSTRTRVSFDVGVRQMGGQSMVLSGADMQLGHGESVADTARVLSRYVDLIMIRTFHQETLHELAENSSVPVINGLTNESHPCQIMADLMTFEEHVGDPAGRKMVWVGDGNNVCNSYLHAAGQFGFEMDVCGPEVLEPSAKAVKFARDQGAKVEITRDTEILKGADLVITDTWASMHDPESTMMRRHNLLRPYQVDERMMALAGEQARFTHCLPAHRGEEVTDAVLDGKQSIAFDAAENRLHAQKAIMRWCLGV